MSIGQGCISENDEHDIPSTWLIASAVNRRLLFGILSSLTSGSSCAAVFEQDDCCSCAAPLEFLDDCFEHLKKVAARCRQNGKTLEESLGKGGVCAIPITDSNRIIGCLIIVHPYLQADSPEQHVQRQAAKRDWLEAARLLGMAVQLNHAPGVQPTFPELNDFFDGVPCGCHSLDRNGQFVRINQTECSWLGYTREEIVGKMNFRDLLTPESARTFDDAFAIFLKTGIARELEFEIVRKDGSALPVLLSASAIRDEAGNVIMSRATAFDISRHKELELKVREQGNLLRELMESIPAMVWSALPDGCVEYFSQRWYDYTGTTAEECLGWGWQNVIHPDDLPSFLSEWKKCRDSGGSPGVECRLLGRGEPAYRWHLLHSAAIRDERGEVIRWCGTATDVHDRKILQEDLRRLDYKLRVEHEQLTMLLDVSKTGIWSWDIKNNHFVWDQRMCKIVGYHGDSFVGTFEEAFSYVHPEDQVLVKRHVEMALDTGLDYNVEHRTLSHDGIVRWVLSRGGLIRDEEGIPAQLDGVLMDITEHKQDALRLKQLKGQLEVQVQELAAARDAAEEAMRVKSIFLACMSHEIRTPLNAIIGMSNALKKTALTHTQEEYVQVITGVGGTLLSIIRDILDFSRIEAGRLDLHPVEVNLFSLVESTAELLAPLARARGNALLTCVDPSLPPMLLADQARLQQVLTNLADNAIKYTDHNEVEISAVGHNETSTTCSVTFADRDRGVGIPEKEIRTIFQPFVQVESSQRRKHGGTGLGLAICKRIVEGMRGELLVQSTPGQGSTFSFTIQLDKPAAQDSLTQPQSDPDALLTGLQNTVPQLADMPDMAGLAAGKIEALQEFDTSMIILVAEDHPINQHVAEFYLSGLGLQCHFAANGLEAVEMFRSGNYALILMDCEMPDLDGFGATMQIRQIEDGSGRHIPIVAMTAYALTGDRERCLSAGMDDYLAKPVEPDSLREVLARRLKRRTDLHKLNPLRS